MNIIFMGTPDFALPSLEKLNNDKLVQVKGVITQPDRPRGRGQKLQPTPVKRKALQLDLDVLQTEDVNSDEFLNKLRSLRPDLIVVVAFGQKLGEELLDLPEKGCLNLHASLLPEYRGSSPIHQVIIDGRKMTGVTTMYMDIGWDTGDIIDQKEVKIDREDTAGSLHDKLARVGADLLVDTVLAIREGKISPRKQNHEKATYAYRLEKNRGKIDWKKDAEAIYNLVRGVNPWPGAYTSWQGKLLKVWQVEPLDNVKINESSSAVPGQVLTVDDEKGIIIKAGNGLIQLLEVQLAGRKSMSARDFLRGYNIKKGEKLG